MFGIVILFLMQTFFLIFMLIIVMLTSGGRNQNYSFICFEAIEDICKSCREIANSGEVNYFSLSDIERIVEKLRYKEVVVESDVRFRVRKAFLAIPVFMFAGFVGLVLFIILYKDNRFVISRGNASLQNLRLHTLEMALEKFRVLADSGEINYFSLGDIECIAGELRREISNRS